MSSCCDISWLAAMLDAEGHIVFNLKTGSRKGSKPAALPQIGFTNQDPDIIGKFRSILDSYEITYHVRFETKGRLSTKPIYMIRIFRRASVRKFLELSGLHLIRLNKKARLVLDFVCSRDAHGTYNPKLTPEELSLIAQFRAA